MSENLILSFLLSFFSKPLIIYVIKNYVVDKFKFKILRDESGAMIIRVFAILKL